MGMSLIKHKYVQLFGAIHWTAYTMYVYILYIYIYLKFERKTYTDIFIMVHDNYAYELATYQLEGFCRVVL